jgi:hypothetical protein
MTVTEGGQYFLRFHETQRFITVITVCQLLMVLASKVILGSESHGKT